MWEFYNKLINNIDDNIIIDRVAVGDTWTVIIAGNYCGAAANIEADTSSSCDFSYLEGKKLKDVALLSKSWNFLEAGVGAAAINAYYNNERFLAGKALPANNTFDVYEDLTAGKKVGMIGHFMHLEGILTKADVHVMERNPNPGDYPDSACEYILPEMDFVFITGSSFVNKTMPRLLQLSQNAFTVVLGPSTTMSDVLFEYGANEVSGLMITDLDAALHTALFNEHRTIFKSGQKLRLLAP